MRKCFFLFSLLIIVIAGYADDQINVTEEVTLSGIRYLVYPYNKEATVIASNYSGSVVIPEHINYAGGCVVTAIDNSAFKDCTKLTSITIPKTVELIGDYAFSGCTGLTNIYYHANNVPSTWASALNDVPVSTTTLYVPKASLEAYKTTAPWSNFENIVAIEEDGIGDYDVVLTFTDGTTQTDTYADGVIPASAYKRLTDVASVQIGDGITKIENSAFLGCTGLTSVTIGCGVMEISAYAFYGCTGLSSVNIPNNVTSIGNYAFYGCSGLTSVAIGSGVKEIGYRPFNNCSGLTSVHISDLAAWCGISFSDIDSNPLSMAHHLYLNGEEVTDLVIPDGLTTISDYAFKDCTGLTSVTIPESVTEMGSYVFNGCNGVKLLSWNTRIVKGWFVGWTSVEKVILGDAVEIIDESAFWGYTSLTSVVIGENVTQINKRAFSRCSSLPSVYIPKSVNYIGEYAFEYCSGLAKAEFSSIEDMCRIDYYAGTSNPLWYAHHLYIGGEEITELVIPDGVKTIGHNAFSGCSYITSVTFPESVTEIQDWAFEYSGLREVVIPSHVTNVGEGVFWHCESLASAVLPDHITYLGGYILGHTALASFTIPKSVTHIGAEALDFTNLSEIVIPEGVNEIEKFAFACNPQLTDVWCYAQEVPTTRYNAFDESPISSATLHVPSASIEAYRASSPWSDFGSIVPIETGISEVDEADVRTITVYDLNGRLVRQPQKGVNVIRYSDGTTKKIIVK